jgi:dUTPase
MNPNNRPPNRQSAQPGAPVELKLQGTVACLYGLKADYHAERHAAKMRKHPLDAGFDLFPARAPVDIKPISKCWSIIWVSTQFHFIIPNVNNVGLVLERSSAFQRLAGGAVIPSIIDAHYSGELIIRVKCLTAEVDEVKVAIDKLANEEIALAQIVVVPYFAIMMAKWDPKDEASLTRRKNGFGSTDSIILRG